MQEVLKQREGFEVLDLPPPPPPPNPNAPEVIEIPPPPQIIDETLPR
jgi:hypothetical protein